MKINLFNNFSQINGPKGLKFQGLMMGSPVVVIRKFDENLGKILPVWVITLCLSKPLHSLKK